MEQRQNKKISFLCLILILLTIFGFALTVPAKAFAEESEETEQTEETKPQADEIVKKMFFFGFRKGEDETRGRYIFAMIYVPDEVYYEDCTYGVTIFPKIYMERFNVYSDYMNNLAAQGKQYLDIVGAVYQPAPEGKVFRCGIGNIRDTNTALTFAFIGYVKDTYGNYAYIMPEYGAYDTLTVGELTNEQILEKLDYELTVRSTFGGITDGELTNEQILEKLDYELTVRSTFGGITDKISELVDSVWLYLVIGCSAVVVIWGAYIGIKIAVAKKSEQKTDVKGMVKNLVVGIVIMFVLAGALPLLIKGLNFWMGG